jgi:hypothetical protein
MGAAEKKYFTAAALTNMMAWQEDTACQAFNNAA